MKIRSGLIAISALAITSWGCSDRQTELPGASPQKFVDIETIESGEGSNDFTLESVEATSRTNIVRLGKRTVAFSNINVTDDLVWRIWNADEGWSTADEVEVVDSGLSLAIIERDGEREWFSESVNVDGALVPPKGVYRFRDLRDGYFVALSPTNLPIHLFRVSSNELTHILEVENPLPDENRGLRATLHPGGEWLSVFPNGDASTQRIISLTDGPRFDAQLPSNAIRYDFDGETYLNDGNEWTRINFELEDTVSFTPPWPAAQSIIRQAAFGGDIGAWVVSVGNNNPMDVWLGGDRFFDLRCIRTPRVFATDDTVFIECSSRVNETDIHLLDREALQIYETLPFSSRATMRGPNNTLVMIDQTNNEVVTWQSESGITRTGVFADTLGMAGGRGVGSRFENTRVTGWIRDDGSVVALPGNRCSGVAVSEDQSAFAYWTGSVIRFEFDEKPSSGLEADLSECGSILGTADLSAGIIGDEESWIHWRNGETVELEFPPVIRLTRAPSAPFASILAQEPETSRVSRYLGNFEENEWLRVRDADFTSPDFDSKMWALPVGEFGARGVALGRQGREISKTSYVTGEFNRISLFEEAAVLVSYNNTDTPGIRLFRWR